MDPYVESPAFWGDCHGSLIAAMRAELNVRLPASYAASIDMYNWIHEPDAETRKILGKADVLMSETRSGETSKTAGQVAAAPATILLPVVRKASSKYIKITDISGQRVVTVIELLSPANKTPGPDRDAYLAKRNEYLASSINLVEIDLLRSGLRMPLGNPPPARSDYCMMVSRAWELPQASYWGLSVRDPLPDLPVPLDAGQAEVQLSLKNCFDRAYDEGRYSQKLTYSVPPTPPLLEADAAWAHALLAGA